MQQRRGPRAAWALLGFLVLTGQALAESSILALAPAEAWQVVCVRNPAELDRKIAALGQQLNLPVPGSPLAMIKGYTGFIMGTDDERPAAMVSMPSTDALNPGKSIVLLIPTKNAKEMLSLLEPTDVGNGVSRIVLAGKESFAVSKADYVLIAATQEMLQKAQSPSGSLQDLLNPVVRQALFADDLTVWINPSALLESPGAQPIRDGLTYVGMDLEQLKDFSAMVFSMSVSVEGLRLSFALDAKPGTRAALAVTPATTSPDSLMIGLPADGFIAAYGMTAGPAAWSLASEVMDGAFDKLPNSGGVAAETVGRIRSLLRTSISDARAVSLSINRVPSGMDGQLTITAIIAHESGAAAARQRLSEVVTTLKSSPSASGGTSTEAERSGVATPLAPLEYLTGAETINGISIDHLRYLPMNQADAASTKGKTLFGEDGVLVRIAAVDDKRLVFTLGGGARHVGDTLDRLKIGAAPLNQDATIAPYRASLPTARSMEGYAALDRIMDVIPKMFPELGDRYDPVESGSDGALTAWTASPFGETGTRTEFTLSTGALTLIKDLAVQRRRPKGPPEM